MFAVHNIHAPPVEIDENGTYTLNGRDRIPLGEPLFTADTMEECEQWRLNRDKIR
jgi:hypothetical protein